MTEGTGEGAGGAQRTPRAAGRAEGDPPGEETGTGRAPRPEEPAEGREDIGGSGADTPST